MKYFHAVVSRQNWECVNISINFSPPPMIRNFNYVFALSRILTEDLELNVHIVVKIFHRIISADATNCRTGLLSFIYLLKFLCL